MVSVPHADPDGNRYEERKVSELQTIIAKSEAQQKELAKIKKDSLELQAKLDMLKRFCRWKRRRTRFSGRCSQAGASGLKVSRVGPRATIDHEVYTEYPIDLEVIGTYHNVGTFLDRIRQFPRIVNISGLRLQGRASEGELHSPRASALHTPPRHLFTETNRSHRRRRRRSQ